MEVDGVAVVCIDGYRWMGAVHTYYALGSFPPTLRSTRNEIMSPGVTSLFVMTFSRDS